LPPHWRKEALLTRRRRRVIENGRMHVSPDVRNSFMTKIASNLQIDSIRLWDTIHETAKFGATPKGGVRRLTLGPEDKQVRDWFRAACEAAGLDVHVDALGSMFALRKGRDMTKPPVGLGSHLDTQPTGGKFDGVLGTLAALEVVRTLNDAGIETEMPICIVNWTNEEGSRFAPAMMASAAYAGDFTTEDILSRKDADGVTVAEALDNIGYRGASAVGTQKFTSFVELHIEQGPILEAEAKIIGVVDSGQGVLWYDGKITGFESHAGTTPMPLRRDALAALSEIVLAMERIAGQYGPKAVGTVGEAVIKSPSRNVIPGEIAFTVDCRSADAAIMDALDRELRAAAADIAARRKVDVTLDLVWRKPPTHFDAKLVDAVENAAAALGYSHRRITSGAGHDACNLNTVLPAAMVFVPCKDGVSHNELEDATQADCAAGANVLMHTVLALAGVAS
jgi:beta-ureidopropionase / N-carbamoyl-L-amino-acid hydrolase